jgi:Caspase domain
MGEAKRWSLIPKLKKSGQFFSGENRRSDREYRTKISGTARQLEGAPMKFLHRSAMALCAFLLCAAMSLAAILPANAEKRIALVVGNSAYRNVPPLTNSANDAKLIAETLKSLGFELVGGNAQLDLDKPGFEAIVKRFGTLMQGADVGLFYYAGHGVQVRGANYLVPVSANPEREADVDFEMLDTALVMRQMEGAGTRLNLIILDACRNNPFGGRALRGSDRGLAQMIAPQCGDGWRGRQQPIHQGPGANRQKTRPRHFRCV